MTSRLPTPGSDDGQWGTILNDYLGVEHNADGSLKRASDIDTAKSTAQAAQQAANTAQTTADAKYTKASTGIPKSDLTTSIQSSLDKADSALQAAPVASVNGKTGAVVLAASDIGAITQSTADSRYIAGTKAATAPSTPSTDDLWYDKGSDVWKRWNGTAWVNEGSAAYISIPSAGLNGKIVRWDNTTGQLEDGTATASAAYAAKAANTICLLGDSIAKQNWDYGVTNPNWYKTQDNGFFIWGNAFSGGRWQHLDYSSTQASYGGSGLQTTNLLNDGHVDNVIAANPAWCTLLIGTNDAVSLVPAVTIFANIQAIVSRLTAAGIQVAVGTILQRASGWTPTMAQIVRDTNAMIRQWVPKQRGVRLVDWYSDLVDLSTGYAAANMTYDGTHPSVKGAIRMGRRWAQAMANIGGLADGMPGDNNGLVSNANPTGSSGSFSGSNPSGGSGTVAAGSICYVGTGTTVVASMISRLSLDAADMAPGLWNQFAISADGSNNGYTLQDNVPSGFSVGDQVYMTAEVQVDPTSAGLKSIQASLLCIGSTTQAIAGYCTSGLSTTPALTPEAGVLGGQTIILRTPTVTIPSGTTNLKTALQHVGVSTVRWGRRQIHKVVV